ncbi:FAD binding domain-containing protein [Stagonosporopsis vannaccii]|nr:FAD binding domain-containing protein [Stagonosporopsis vannaccii]
MALKEQVLDDNCVLIIGGGPIGMLSATVLAWYGVSSVVLERNSTTTLWPKMDFTNVRSMELLRKIQVADMVREKGVPSHFPYSVLFSAGLNASKPLSSWEFPSVDAYRDIIASSSADGTQPQEPYQRISQAIFEANLRKRCEADPLIDLRFNWKVESVEETEEKAKTVAIDLKANETWTFISKYVIGCDGASSRARRSLQIPLDGGPTPVYASLVHFKSRDLARLYKHGRFWHLFTVSDTHGLNGAVICQDEVDTFTTHLFLPIEQESAHMTPEEVVAAAFGGTTGPYPIKIDEVLVRSTYHPYIAVARSYSGPHKRVFLAGDSAHQNVPTGGYGMNMGISDAFAIGWQLAAVIKGHCDHGLLQAYEAERRPVALISVDESGKHLGVHMGVSKLLSGQTDRFNDESQELYETLDRYYQTHDGENKSLGIEMGYRYQSPVIIPDNQTPPPQFDPRKYTPSTWPGMRAPHLVLKDGTAIFDLMGPLYTLVEFADNCGSDLLLEAAKQRGLPLKLLRLKGEENAFKIWGERLVLVRPDYHVAWRASEVKALKDAERIIAIIGGFVTSKPQLNGITDAKLTVNGGFSSTSSHITQKKDFKLDRIGAMQV